MMDFWNEKYIVDILKRIKGNDKCNLNDLLEKDSNYNIALADCIKKRFINGIEKFPTAEGKTYTFQTTDVITLTELGMFYLNNRA